MENFKIPTQQEHDKVFWGTQMQQFEDMKKSVEEIENRKIEKFNNEAELVKQFLADYPKSEQRANNTIFWAKVSAIISGVLIILTVLLELLKHYKIWPYG